MKYLLLIALCSCCSTGNGQSTQVTKVTIDEEKHQTIAECQCPKDSGVASSIGAFLGNLVGGLL